MSNLRMAKRDPRRQLLLLPGIIPIVPIKYVRFPLQSHDSRGTVAAGTVVVVVIVVAVITRHDPTDGVGVLPQRVIPVQAVELFRHRIIRMPEIPLTRKLSRGPTARPGCRDGVEGLRLSEGVHCISKCRDIGHHVCEVDGEVRAGVEEVVVHSSGGVAAAFNDCVVVNAGGEEGFYAEVVPGAGDDVPRTGTVAWTLWRVCRRPRDGSAWVVEESWRYEGEKTGGRGVRGGGEAFLCGRERSFLIFSPARTSWFLVFWPIMGNYSH
jgi:hypothetical protein